MTIENILNNWRSGEVVSNDNLMKLYEAAKEAYYNGVQIMPDFEFDSLEISLGLENKAYVGTKHNPKYTIKHPFTMGSLSKVQIHKTKDGSVDWMSHYADIMKFIPSPTTLVLITPKFDGCSFEAQVHADGTIDSISSRGDGTWGKDYSKHLKSHVTNAIKNVTLGKEVTYRGEVLIKKSIFEQKYAEFVNPRSFVSGILNRDFDDTAAEICKDLSIIIYDVRINNDNTWKDVDWTLFYKEFNSGVGYIETENLPAFFKNNIAISSARDLSCIYEQFDTYRSTCEFALDGIVIKPVDSIRINNLTEHRPSDCVAIKFIPMLEETEVVDIVWNLGKSEEYTPIIITKPVVMDGKSVTRAKANNIGYLMKNKISIGTKVVLSLAGDIIPFIYKITDTSKFDSSAINVPENTKVDGIHLMAVLTDDERTQQQLRNSMLTLNIPGVGGSAANTIVEFMKAECAGDEFFGEDAKPFPCNIFLLTPAQLNLALGGKTGENVRKAFDTILKDVDLKTIICSCNFKLCGGKVAEQVANYLTEQPYDFASMAREGYEWCFNPESTEMMLLNKILAFTGHSITYFKEKNTIKAQTLADSNQIPVILTGEPNNYRTKSEFLKAHPEYRNTTKWSECKIVFTNSLDSNTGKMKQARAKGIEIRVY